MLHKNNHDTDQILGNWFTAWCSKRKKRVLLLCIGTVLCAAWMFYLFILTGSSAIGPGVKGNSRKDVETLKVMTLNIAHGRGNGPNQIWQNIEQHREHLNTVAALITRTGSCIAAFQEADGPCSWSGEFDHVKYIAEQSGYSFYARGEHVKGPGLSYGTAVISNIKLNDIRSVTFPAAGLAPAKGFLHVTFQWPGRNIMINVVSVHLHFGSSSVRENQVKVLVRELSECAGYFIVMGDFNCDSNATEQTLYMLMRDLHLHTFDYGADTMGTFPKTGKRLDWIFISSELEFVSYRVIPDIVSDHLGVYADIRIKEQANDHE